MSFSKPGEFHTQSAPQDATSGDDDAPQELPAHFPLRDDLQFHHRNDGSGRVVLEDPAAGKFFRIGPNEYAFIRFLLETQSAAKALHRCQDAAPDNCLTTDHATQLCKWLAGNGLTQSAPQPQAPSGIAGSPVLRAVSAVFFWKLPLVDPDRYLAKLVGTAGWLFSARAMVVGLLVFAAALVAMTGHWDPFFDSYTNLFSASRWIWLGIAWCVLKAVHETAHGATCKRYGGDVHEAGLAMILLMPIAYVDVTSSWRFDSRWKRFHVTMAGIAAELFLAGVALFVWYWSTSLPVQQIAAEVVLLASVSSLLFNLNPLLKFDGYFALADATGVDNLYTYGQKYARYFGGRYLLGLNATAPQLPSRHAVWIKWYGCSAAAYRVVTVSGLLAGAAMLFEGAGIVVAIGGLGSFVVMPLIGLWKHLANLYQNGTLNPVRLITRVTLLVSACSIGLWVTPADWSWTAPAIVQYDPPAVVRTRSAGFVDHVHIQNGDSVQRGDALVTLRNDELTLRLMDLQKQVAQVENEILAAQWRGNSSEMGDAVTRRDGLAKQVIEQQEQVSSLTLRATTDGKVVSRILAVIEGTYVEEGEEIAVIGREDSKRLKVSISQQDARQANLWRDQPLRIVVAGHPSWNARIERLETRAALTPPDPSLLAMNGGSLTSVHAADGEFELCEPRVNAYLPLDPQRSRALRTGQRASVVIHSNHQTLGQRLTAAIGNAMFQLKF
ncbi:Peptidase family M50 [Rubripirellula lacrimiformis]|uniref:Peptidase family M50 n=1 Tax=Rubripirellula lacrimiformis TaxID=1930273 RepID=A0A517NBD1_9BACT|nr:efflux RND transporter periplasmic adaptor subunit [Rubripirellula lacrimiformis]QDT04442.1 Peptidase family M50 [Rubripirellula lacrimiformis]